MRTAGDVAAPDGLSVHDHLCWVFDDAADFHRRASRFLAEGVEQGLAVVWVGAKPHDELAAELVGLDVDRLERSGTLSILDLPTQRPDDGPSDPGEQAAFWADWGRRATASGYRGLRVAGDGTPWVRTPEEQAVHLAYEVALDRVTRGAPVSVMCAFDRSLLGAEVAAAFAEVHPLASIGATRFQLYFDDEHDLALRGEVDLTDATALRRTLELVAPGPVMGPGAGEIHVDAGALLFIDHHGMLVLDRFGEERDATLVLHDARSTCAREVVDLLGLRHVVVADAGRRLRPVEPVSPRGRGRGVPEP
ncbi:MEDS domain-containing protein [Actinotalea sp. Marseille-Q4924]|uniref:MEDS domain-containing protein n=1 Tax=Actinotalea sp. Marseille-Q4924 TaxID=2866571 RepID=UPI001CE429C9|nr:MEDS domain-containing protein [Actinotalea sp. Marseille-Q4924]